MSRRMTKPTNWPIRPAKTQISLGIRPASSESSLTAWRKTGHLTTYWAHSEDSDQTGRMPRLIWVFARRTCHFVGFVMRLTFSVLIHWWVKVLVVCSSSVCLRLLVWFVQDSLVAICWERTSCPLVLFYILTDLKKHNTSFFMKGSKWPFSLHVKGLTVVSISRESVYQKLNFKCHTCDRRKFVRTVAHCFCHQHIAFVYIHSSLVSTLVCFLFFLFAVTTFFSAVNGKFCFVERIIEPRHDKTNKMSVRPPKTQLNLSIRPVWSESSLSAWRKLGSLATHRAHSKDSDQTGRMPRLIWVFAGRTLILLVLSCRGSYGPTDKIVIVYIQTKMLSK